MNAIPSLSAPRSFSGTPPARGFSRFDLIFLALTGIAFFSLFRALPSTAPYGYDEADYMAAASRGFTANLLERPSISVIDFVKTGLGIGIDRNKRANLSEFIRDSKDITFLRHYHGPVYFYWLAAVGGLFHEDEYSVRFSGLIFHFLGFLVIYVTALNVVEIAPRTAAIVSSCLFLFSSSDLGTAVQVSPHIPYVLFTILSLACFARFLQTAALDWWYGAVAAFALAFCSIEYAILIPIAFAVSLFCLRWSGRTKPLLARPVPLRSALIFFGTVIVLWPMGLLKLSALKGYFYISYLALLRKGSYGTESAAMIWSRRFLASPIEYSLAIVCIVALLAMRKLPSRHLLVPCLAYATLMFLTTLKNTSLNPTYVSSILPALALVSGATVAFLLRRIPRAGRLALTTLLILAIAFEGYRRLPPPYAPNPGRSNLLASLQEAGIERASVLVPFDLLPTLSYYFPSMKFRSYLPDETPAGILEKLRTGGYQAMVYAGAGDEVSKRIEGYFSRTRRIAESPLTLYVAPSGGL